MMQGARKQQWCRLHSLEQWCDMALLHLVPGKPDSALCPLA